uniref:VWFA domain-containing protein n=1 Tax=Pelodiscus sinensis TaxID=13735 RepID=K7GHG1_PELSI
ETLTGDCLTPAVLAPSRGFSVDVEGPTTFQEAAVGFGQSVVQLGNSSTGGLIIGAPLQIGNVNETGKVYNCDVRSKSCQEIPIQRPTDATNMSLGLSLAARGSQFLACGPTVHRACGENMHLNGYCFLLDQSLQQLQRIPDTQPECPKHITDIVLLIDGSSSILTEDFRKMKTFLSEIMKHFYGTDTQFALRQYSNKFKEHFDFTEYRSNRDPDDLVQGVKQLHGTTHTATAIWRVVRELFTSWKGAREEATKILIVITDGQKFGDPRNYSDVIPEAEKAGIIRYAIGVGRAFSSYAAQQELREIASAPADQHVFWVDNFDALQGIQSQLQEKIFPIEGTQSQSGSSFQLEMSQEGFSSLLSLDGPVLGAVGAYDWSGGIYLYGNSGKPSFINISRTSRDMNDAYLGYSSQVVTANGQSRYVVGAPRYQHTGKVVLFGRDTKSGEWAFRSEVMGEQIGSYFGGTLCAVDLNSDENTDLILIGAPMYHTPSTGGRVCVCLINWPGATLICSKTLQGQVGQVSGRFGASMSEIGDISGDGQTDVAIGAPMEDNNHGALYIFHGEKGGLSPRYRQRIGGAQFPSRLHYFGQAVSGGTDLTGDGLPDIAVGAQGQVLLLRSRPVLRVGITINFQPTMIPTSAINCQEQEQLSTEASETEICFTITKSTRDNLGDEIFSMIQYSLALDPGRMKIRAGFGSTGPVLSGDLRLGIETKCEKHQEPDMSLSFQFCPEDTLAPITLRLNYTLTGEPIAATGLKPILSEDSALVSAGLLPFQKDCGTDGRCDDQLEISFNFSGLSTLVVGVMPEFNITVSIQNHGENSYSTTVRFFYPAALSYRRVLLLQVPRCTLGMGWERGPAGGDDSEGRGCVLPCWEIPDWVKAVFIATFDVSSEADLGDRLQITASASSDNGGPVTERMVHQAELPVKYGIFIILSSLEESTKYVNFSAKAAETSAPVTHQYEVKNLRQRSVPLSVTFQFPVELSGVRVWDASEVVPSKAQPQLAQCISEVGTPGSKDFVKQMSERPLLNCSVATCKKIRCTIASLEMQQPLEFMIKGNVSFQWVSQTLQQKVTLVSEAWIEYEEKKYTQKEGFVQRQVQTMVQQLVVYNYLPIIVGSSVGGLVLLALITAALYKFGFFKRQYKEMMDTLEDEGAGPTQSAT